jgi:hypothetical protein
MRKRLFDRQNLHVNEVQRALQVRQHLAQHVRLYERQLALERRLGSKLRNPFLTYVVTALASESHTKKKKKREREKGAP